jgi:hypothetical protein
VSETILYDSQGRLAKHTKNLNGSKSFSYSYNANGQLETLTYPDNFSIKYSYTPTGKLDSLKRGSDNSLIYKVNSRNQYHQTLNAQYGNGVTTTYSYNQFGLITGIQSGTGNTVLNYSYGYNTKGMMNFRQETNVNREEVFSYDNLDRLTSYTFGPIRARDPITQFFSYAPNGNITSNSLLGIYDYNIPKPHAVTNIIPVDTGVFTTKNCEVEYNFFNQPTLITDDVNELTISYGANQQRNQAVLKRNDTTISNRFYINKYCEFEPISANESIYYQYIYGDNGIVALHVGKSTAIIKSGFGEEEFSGDSLRTVGIDSMYYIHTDHLGSYCAITDKNKTVRQRNFFDPWGNNVGAINYYYYKPGNPHGAGVYSMFTYEVGANTAADGYPYNLGQALEFKLLSASPAEIDFASHYAGPEARIPGQAYVKFVEQGLAKSRLQYPMAILDWDSDFQIEYSRVDRKSVV